MNTPKIFDCNTASKYKPEADTIIIRIFDSYHQKLDKYPNFLVYPSLEHRNDFYEVIELFYDDVDATRWDEDSFNKMVIEEDIVPFSLMKAKALLERIDSITHKDLKKYNLVVHCRAGVARSTATFIALNELYDLGYRNLKEAYPHYNRQVYNMLMEASKNK